MKTRYALFGLLLLITGQASAQQYAIHLDTSESADLRNHEGLNVYGNLYTVEATQGFTTTLLGPYQDKHAAGEVLNSVREVGYYAAFITKHKKVNLPKSDIVALEELAAEKVISRLN